MKNNINLYDTSLYFDERQEAIQQNAGLVTMIFVILIII